jgi:hypothetical protein
MYDGFQREEWFRLPLELRRRWWRDTDYGKRPPSPEMVEAIEKVKRGEWKPTTEEPDDDEADPFEPPCVKCDHPDARDARREIFQIVIAIRRRERKPRSDYSWLNTPEGLPFSCCRRKPRPVESGEGRAS